jgi:hypothetical protein
MSKGLSKAERHAIKRDGVRLELKAGGISAIEYYLVRPKWWRKVAAPEIKKRARWSFNREAWISKRDPYWATIS